MSRFTGWLLVLSVVILTGIATYEYAVIERLQWVISILMSGNAH